MAAALSRMVAASGIRTLGEEDYQDQPHSAMIVAVSLMLGMIPTVGGKLLDQVPASVAPFTHSGMFLGILGAIVLQLLFRQRHAT